MTIPSSTRLIPRSVLFSNPTKTSPLISPDGTQVAYLSSISGTLNIFIRSLENDNIQCITEDNEYGVHSYFWAANSKQILYFVDKSGDENFHLHRVNIETKEDRDLTPFDDVQTHVIDCSKYCSSKLIIELNKDNPQIHDAYSLDLNTGEITLVARNPGNVVTWITDAEMKVRGCVAILDDGSSQLLIRATEDNEWQSLLTWGLDDILSSEPIGFSLDGQSMYLIDSRNANTGRLVKLHIYTGELEVLAEDEQYDISSVILCPNSGEIQAVAFTKARIEWKVLQEDILLDFNQIHNSQQGDFSIISRDDMDTRWIISFTTDNNPINYYLYDRKTSSTAFLFSDQPEIHKYTLSHTKPITFTARDGLTIQGYLTLPKDTVQKNLPMVLNVHEGPWERDTWRYDPEVQWFVNRGYACLQVNYRGSTGYGKHFLNAGNKEWGRNMQNDLIDAVTWAIHQEIADPRKIAIYGGSYGGYAALVGATFTPEVFCCAVDIAGPSDLYMLLKTLPAYWFILAEQLYARVGNPNTEENLLRERSPLFKINQIKIPVFIAQGANDPRVNQAESEKIVKALKEKGLNYEYMLFPDEGHGFLKLDNRIKFYAAVEKFLATYLGGIYEIE